MATITPVTTPESTTEEKDCLVSQVHAQSKHSNRWYCAYPPPYAILLASFLEIIVYEVATKEIQELLRFNPVNQVEIWRFVTYMFLHNNTFHITLNIVIQCLFSITLEKNQGSLRVGLLYLGSGAIGGLGASCVRPDLVIGASAGVYGLLISHLSHIILNYNSSKYKVWVFLSVIIIVASDVIYYLFIHYQDKSKLTIAEGAHVGGAIGGFLLGLLLYQSSEKESKIRNRVLFWVALMLLIILIAIPVTINLKIRKCTPDHELKVRYKYTC